MNVQEQKSYWRDAKDRREKLRAELEPHVENWTCIRNADDMTFAEKVGYCLMLCKLNDYENDCERVSCHWPDRAVLQQIREMIQPTSGHPEVGGQEANLLPHIQMLIEEKHIREKNSDEALARHHARFEEKYILAPHKGVATESTNAFCQFHYFKGNQQMTNQELYFVLDVGPSDDAGLTTTVNCLPGTPAIAELVAVPPGFVVHCIERKPTRPIVGFDDNREPLPFKWFDRDEHPNKKKPTSTVNA